ncbi:MAG: FecR domain-containing protein [Pedobacter sp.]|jgi:ferric-dicitrate binding protein FerR (iron transport regulator)
MEKNILQKLIEKYLKGNCTPEEVAAIHEWYNLFEQEQDPIDFISSEQQQELKQRLLSRIRTNITSLDIESKQPDSGGYISRTLVYSLSGVAAMIILAVGLVFFSHNASDHPASGDRVVVNMTKTIQKLVLSDGTIVWLNPKSRVIYPERFTAGQRKVQMQGEAFFEVTPNLKRPFIIYSGNVVTRVWGTSFRIRAYKNIPVEVSVVTGKVSVRLQHKEDSEIMLLPDQKVTYLRESSSLKKDIEKKTSDMRIWQKTSMSFDDESIEEVIKVLNKQFGVHISSSDKKVLNYVLKADFTEQSLPSILEMLKKSLDVEYEINDQEIILNTIK